jgi:hypothetical protein
MPKVIRRKKVTSKPKTSKKSAQKKKSSVGQKGGFAQSFLNSREKNPVGFKALQDMLTRHISPTKKDPTQIGSRREPIIGFTL